LLQARHKSIIDMPQLQAVRPVADTIRAASTLVIISILIGLPALAARAQAQDYPTRSVRILAGAAAGARMPDTMHHGCNRRKAMSATAI
jgi:hypothetical protein